MRRQVQEYKRANSIGWVGPIGYGNTSVVEIVGTRTPWDKDVPHPSMDTSLFQHWGEKAPVGSVFVSAISHELTKQFVAETSPVCACTCASSAGG
jgi:hypothetical protein